MLKQSPEDYFRKSITVPFLYCSQGLDPGGGAAKIGKKYDFFGIKS